MKDLTSLELTISNPSKDDRIFSIETEFANNSIVNRSFVSESDAEICSLNKEPPEDGTHKTITLEKSKGQSWIKRRIYITSWIRKYDKNSAISDVIAGVTLGLTIIPQSIAYAALADLPSQYGLYAAFVGAFVYVIFGTIKEVSIGPTSLMSLLTLQYTYGKPVEFTIILAFLAGLVELTMGLLELGFLVDFISAPVTSAFTSATAVIIIGSQLKNLLGIKAPSKGFMDSIVTLFENIRTTTKGDYILGILCTIFLLLLRQIARIPFKTNTKRRKFLKKFLWYVSISRNAITVIVSSLVAYYWTNNQQSPVPFALSADVEPGIPTFQLPPFQITQNNHTYTFTEICSELGSGLVLVPLVAVLANVAIAKSFCTEAKVDASQEMLTLGLCNVLGSFFRSMPTCGAFTRSAVSQASGVKTPLSGIYSGAMVISALSLLTPYFHYIPKATLAAVLICAVAFMIDLHIIVRLWKESRRDLIGWFGCFIACISLGVEIGLLFGIVLNIFYLLLKWARPRVEVKLSEIENMQYIYIKPNAGLFFPGVDFIKEKISAACVSAQYQVPVVLDCTRISGLDFTSAEGIQNLAKDLNKHHVILILYNMEQRLQKYIDISTQIYFCTKESTIKEILLQDSIRNGKVPLKEHIRASIDLGYDIEPDVNVNEISESK